MNLEFCVFALLVATTAACVAVGMAVERRRGHIIENYERRRCIHCGYDVHASTVRCSECGADLIDQSVKYWRCRARA